jgi:hypothetical protein
MSLTYMTKSYLKPIITILQRRGNNMPKFHIHVDCKSYHQGFADWIAGKGFYPDNFLVVPGMDGYEPVTHFTSKLDDPEVFRTLFAEISNFLDTNPGHSIDGYLEGEVVVSDIEIPEAEFKPAVLVPVMCKVTPTPLGCFRESEIHISLDRDRSHANLRWNIQRMGFSPAYQKEEWGIKEIWTIQGSQIAIKTILQPVVDYLWSAGGGVKCKIREEQIARWKANPPSFPIPPMIYQIAKLDRAEEQFYF